jgi:hypothetical protein
MAYYDERAPHYMTSTSNRNHHAGLTQVSSPPAAAQPASPPNGRAAHSKPFYLSAAGGAGRAKNFKNTFSPFTYESGGVQPLSNDASITAHRWRAVDHKGAPSTVHRGVTSLRGKSTEQGVFGSTAPVHNVTLAGTKDKEWRPSDYGNGHFKIGDNFRRRGEGLAGVQRHQAAIDRHHQGKAYSQGANVHHDLFDRDIRSNSRDYSMEPSKQFAGGASELLKASRVPHRTQFVGAGLGTPSQITGERGYLGGHAQLPYHYSDYSYSEKSLSDTKIANGIGNGFRIQCHHQVHHPMKATTHRVRGHQETDRNANFQSVQEHDETSRHTAKADLARARAAQTARG